MAGVGGRLRRKPAPTSKARPRWLYHVGALDAWIIEYRRERGIEPPSGSPPRKCLRCDEEFDSEHIGNRLCPRCANAASSGRQRTENDWNYCFDVEGLT